MFKSGSFSNLPPSSPPPGSLQLLNPQAEEGEARFYLDKRPQVLCTSPFALLFLLMTVWGRQQHRR